MAHIDADRPVAPVSLAGLRFDYDPVASVLMWLPTGTAYPDSGKVALYTGDPAEDVVVERASAVDCCAGESGPGAPSA